ncbi:MAG: hypothetical protein ABSF29_15925, partial [Tepidisphaeraceae bacterium]
MFHLSRRVGAMVIAGMIGFGGAVVMADPPTTQPSNSDLQSQIQQLKDQVAQLKANSASTSAQSQADEEQAVKETIREADQNSNLMDAGGGLTGGWDSTAWKFYLASDDGNFYFHPGFWTQVRYVGSYKSANPPNWENGFEIRRFKLYADGNFINKDITYKVQLENTDAASASTPMGGTMYIEYAWFNYVFMHNVAGGDLALKVGLMKDPVFHEEEATSDNSLLMVDRSMADNLAGGNSLAGPYVQGINFQYTGNDNPLHIQTLFDNGDGSQNTNFTDVNSATPALLGAPSTVTRDYFGSAIRGDYKFFGDWVDNTDATGKNYGKHDFLGAGAGVSFSQSDTAVSTVGIVQGPPVSTATTTVHTGTDVTRWDADATYMTAGNFIIYTSYSGDYENFRGTVSGQAYRVDQAELLQGGYFLNPALELTARGSLVELDPHFKVGGNSTFSETG